MKTTDRTIRRMIILIIISLLVLPTSLLAQRYGYQISKMKYGIGVTETISANGHGCISNVDLKIKKGKKEIQLGVNIQNQNRKIAGLNLNLNRYLGDYYEPQNSYFSLSLRYFCNCEMSKRLNEEFHNSEYTGKIERFNTIEAFAGFGLKTHLTKNVYIENKIGFGIYANIIVGDDNRYIPDDLFREDIGASLLLSTGIHFEF